MNITDNISYEDYINQEQTILELFEVLFQNFGANRIYLKTLKDLIEGHIYLIETKNVHYLGPASIIAEYINGKPLKEEEHEERWHGIYAELNIISSSNEGIKLGNDVIIFRNAYIKSIIDLTK